MKKTINKIVGLFSLGLLLFAAQYSYAKTGAETMFQDAWEFMGKRTSDSGSGFKQTFGKNISEVASIVTCGPKKCNLAFRKCMAKKIDDDRTDYLCVETGDVASYKQQGYAESSGGANSHKDSKKAKDKECYEAKVASDSTNAQVKVYCAKVTGDTVEILAGESEDKTCQVVEVSWYNNRNCLFCPLLGVVYAVADKMAVTSHKTFARSFAIVMVVGLAVWLAFKTITFVSNLAKQDIAKYITELLIQSFKFAMAFFALLYYDQIFTMLILPLMRAGMEFGTSFVLVEDLSTRFGNDVFSAIVSAASSGDGSALSNLGDKVPSDYIRNANNKFFDVYTYATMENLAHNVNLEYSLLQSIGGSLVCNGFKFMLNLFDTEHGGLGLGFASITYGICFGLFGFLLSMAFVFYLLDVVVQLGIVGALLPFLVASWPFKITSKYTSTGFEMLLNSIFVFMMMGVVVSLSMELIQVAVEYNTDGGSGDVAENGISGLITALSERDVKKLERMVNVISIGFILFLVTNIMSMLLLKKTQEFAGQFAQGGMPSISSDMATRAASTAVSAAKKAGGAVLSGVGSGIAEGTKGVREKIKNGVQGLSNSVNRFTKGIKLQVGRKLHAGLIMTETGRAMMKVRNNLVEAQRDHRLANMKKQSEKKNKNAESIKNIMGNGEGGEYKEETHTTTENQGGENTVPSNNEENTKPTPN